jgi:hypothetical protein
MELKIYEQVEKDTLRHRETAQKLLQTINKHPEEPVILNFKGITFASRSFLHELLSGLHDREINYKNTNEEIHFMTKIAFTKPVLKLETKNEVKELVSA